MIPYFRAVHTPENRGTTEHLLMADSNEVHYALRNSTFVYGDLKIESLKFNSTELLTIRNEKLTAIGKELVLQSEIVSKETYLKIINSATGTPEQMRQIAEITVLDIARAERFVVTTVRYVDILDPKTVLTHETIVNPYAKTYFHGSWVRNSFPGPTQWMMIVSKSGLPTESEYGLVALIKGYVSSLLAENEEVRKGEPATIKVTYNSEEYVLVIERSDWKEVARTLNRMVLTTEGTPRPLKNSEVAEIVGTISGCGASTYIARLAPVPSLKDL